MAKVEIVESLSERVIKIFKGESIKVFQHLKSLETEPKLLGSVGGIVIKEIKYKGFRFYFLAEGYKLKFLSVEDLIDLLLRFVRMSTKKHQQKTIDEIKEVLKIIGPKGFE